MNVALVVLDTLRKDAFDDHFEWLSGTRFERAFSTSDWTVSAHASLFTGYYPGELGVHAHHTTLDCPEDTLAERLAGTGYTTRAFSSNVQVSWAFDFDRGFDEFEGSWRLRGLSENVFDWGEFISENRERGAARYMDALRKCVVGDFDTLPSLRRGLYIKLRDLGIGGDHPDDGAKEALDYVRETQFGDDEFLFMNLMEPHAPYAPPEEYQTTNVPVEELTAYDALVATIEGGKRVDSSDSLRRQAYNDSVRYLSDIYRDIFAELRDEFDIVITVGDHGECFGEHGLYQHAFGLAPELTHVPLVVSGRHPTGSHEGAVSLLDVRATILDAADLHNSERGRSLLDDPESRPVFTEYHGVTDSNRARVEAANCDPDPYDQRLFGVGTDSNYGYENLDETEVTGDEEHLRELIKEHRESGEWRDLGADQPISGEIRRRLADLGYA